MNAFSFFFRKQNAFALILENIPALRVETGSRIAGLVVGCQQKNFAWFGKSVTFSTRGAKVQDPLRDFSRILQARDEEMRQCNLYSNAKRVAFSNAYEQFEMRCCNRETMLPYLLVDDLLNVFICFQCLYVVWIHLDV